MGGCVSSKSGAPASQSVPPTAIVVGAAPQSTLLVSKAPEAKKEAWALEVGTEGANATPVVPHVATPPAASSPDSLMLEDAFEGPGAAAVPEAEAGAGQTARSSPAAVAATISPPPLPGQEAGGPGVLEPPDDEPEYTGREIVTTVVCSGPAQPRTNLLAGCCGPTSLS
uniref:Uncharacterized protein n=1 Tax=Pyrodinium bahamense TaxID=73915 RepID=A0A7S0BB13_9DINO